MHKVIIRPRAKTDIKKIWRYSYDNWGVKQATSYTTALELAIEAMPKNPEIGIAIDAIRKGYRQYAVKRHFIIYRLTPTNIDIVRILGGSMEVKRHV